MNSNSRAISGLVIIGAALAAAIPLALPYLAPGHQIAHDRLVPFMRTHSLLAALGEAQVPPRWFVDFDGGYGSPYPSFYAMLFYYPAAFLYSFGMPVGSAVELTAFLTLVVSGLTMFLFVSRFWGKPAGLISAILYVYSPYHLVDAYDRGAYSELASFVWLPLVALSFLTCFESKRRHWVILTALSLASLILTHNLTALIFLPSLAPLLMGWRLGQPSPLPNLKHGVGRIAFAATLGLTLACFFWMPILFERTFVRLDYFLHFDYRGDFVPLRGLVWPSEDMAMATYAGIMLAVLPVLAIASSLIDRADHSQRMLLLTLFALGWSSLLMATRFSDWVWRSIPLLHFVQFPWRFLVPGSFYLAAAAGPAASLIGQGRRSWVVAFGVGIVAIWLYADLAEIQRRTTVKSLGTDAICSEVWGTQDYRPSWSNVPFWRDGLPPEVQSGEIVLPPCPGRLIFHKPPAVRVLDAGHEGTSWVIRYFAAAETSVTLSQFYYPGWRATVDDTPLTLTPSSPEGLISLPLPRGEHELKVFFEETPLRRAANTISLVGSILTVALVFPYRVLRRPYFPKIQTSQ